MVHHYIQYRWGLPRSRQERKDGMKVDRLKWGLVRYHPSAEARDGALPSLCLVLPLGPIRQWSDERPLDELELLVNPGPDGRTVGST